MGLEFKTILLLTLLLISLLSCGQSVTKKELSDKWAVNLLVDSIKVGDTITFKKDKTYKNFFLKSNGDLKEQAWYAKCGNKFFLDNFAKKPPKWVRAGFWNLNSTDNNIILKMVINEKPFFFRFLDRKENQFKFIFIE